MAETAGDQARRALNCLMHTDAPWTASRAFASVKKEIEAARSAAFLEAREILSLAIMKEGGTHYRCGPCKWCEALQEMERRQGAAVG